MPSVHWTNVWRRKLHSRLLRLSCCSGKSLPQIMRACVRACMRACVRVCVRACMNERERERQRERERERERERALIKHSSMGIFFKNVWKMCTYVWTLWQSCNRCTITCDHIEGINVKHTRCVGVLSYTVHEVNPQAYYDAEVWTPWAIWATCH